MLRTLAGVAVLVALGLHLGAEPFLAGLRAVDPVSMAAALVIGLVTTVCSAWRWSLVARGLGLALPVREALAECYRSVFLNSVLPAGVLGDVDRAVRHGRRTGAPARCARAVVTERVIGLAVLVAVAAVVLAGRLPGPGPAVVGVALVVLVFAIGLTRGPRHHASGPGAARRPAGLGTLRFGAGVAAMSAVALAGYLATFLIAARAAGATAPVGELLPVLLLALLAMALPVNVGGWGPREAATAAGFGLVGLGAAQGLSAAVVYGVLSFVACLPGLVVLLIGGRLLRSGGTGSVLSSVP
jgi:uncharacterized membrane protein YbhN (UPF0104 family)